jgi:hypothetical protein
MRTWVGIPLLACSLLVIGEDARGGVETTTTTVPTSSTTVTTTSTTTTTVPPDPCAGAPVGATFLSIACRLDVLVEGVAGDTAFGAFQPKLLKALGKAQTQVAEGEVYCIGADVKHAGKRLKKVRRALIQFSHRLRSRSARKKLAEETREPPALEADTLGADAQTLRDALICPPAEG